MSILIKVTKMARTAPRELVCNTKKIPTAVS